MNKFYLYITGIILFLILTPLYVSAKPGEAPGKLKNQNNKPANAENKQEEKKKNDVNIGSVIKVSDSVITVQDKKGKNKISVEIDNDTKILGKDNKLIKIGTIKLKDMLALVGTESAELNASSGGIIKAKKIFVKEATTSAQSKRHAVSGIITNIIDSLISLSHQIQRDRIFRVQTNSDTIVIGKEASGSSALAVGQRIAAIGDDLPDGTVLAKRIHIIPGSATGIFRRFPLGSPVASASAIPSPSASPSALPSPAESSSPSASPEI